MKPTLNDQDLAIADLLNSNNIYFRVMYQGYGVDIDDDRDPPYNRWEHDQWSVYIGKNPQSTIYSFDYKTGIGHRFNRKNKPNLTKWRSIYPDEKNQRVIFQCSNSTHDLIMAPTQASVLYYLLLDVEAANQSFNDWCDYLGYSNDSMRAFNIYQQCCDTGRKIRSIFSRDLIEQISEILEDY